MTDESKDNRMSCTVNLLVRELWTHLCDRPESRGQPTSGWGNQTDAGCNPCWAICQLCVLRPFCASVSLCVKGNTSHAGKLQNRGGVDSHLPLTEISQNRQSWARSESFLPICNLEETTVPYSLGCAVWAMGQCPVCASFPILAEWRDNDKYCSVILITRMYRKVLGTMLIRAANPNSCSLHELLPA
jgi:hypothetical protein